MATPQDDYNTPTFTTTKPWSEFFSTSHLSLPVSVSDLTTRVAINLSYFKLNYLHLTLTIFFISLFFRPLSLFIFFLTAAAWHFVYLTRLPDAAIELAGFTISENIVVGVLGVVTVVALLFASVWMNFFVSVAVSVVVVLLHAAVRDSRFGDDNPYGGLLDDEAGGGYTEF
ncbi:PRA1 family protein D-like [Silene latifolia]|uniref:PRA1 family protein D-like n=1 Tax=Silene latifolia TaxID=37657 RepID=UPI003D780DAE